MKYQPGHTRDLLDLVAPLAGAWIEIGSIRQGRNIPAVAPLAGAWIEMFMDIPEGDGEFVAPLAGAWIEIVKAKVNMDNVVSLPSRERGLK